LIIYEECGGELKSTIGGSTIWNEGNHCAAKLL
jgi:hypothetical protein